MRKIFTTAIALLLWSWHASAQDFTKRVTTPLADVLTGVQAEWVVLNSDSLLDLVVSGVVDGQLKIIAYDNDLVMQSTTLASMKAGYIQLADWNRDNKVDILVAGKTLADTDALFCFINNGDFTFTKQSQKIIDHSGPFTVGDLDGDGTPDILTFANNALRIYDASGAIKFGMTGIDITDVSICDMNKDGVNDFTVSGPSLTTVFINKRNFKFERMNAPNPIDGVLSLADFDNDGRFDIIVANANASKTWRNNGDTLIVDKTFDGLQKLQLFTGDMTSDGITDIVTDTTVDITNLIIQKAGDRDRDGDLDVVQLIDSLDGQWLKLYENTTAATNASPGCPSTGYAVSTFDKTFIFWQPASDDHTATPTLTYDVWLGNSDGNIITPSYDLSSRRRTVVRHGNAGTNTSMIIKGLTDARYFYEIQSVDNAYNGSASACTGGVLPCFDLVHQDVQACKGYEVTLTGGVGAVWFSLSKGFLGESDDLTFVAMDRDTVFAFTPQAADCSKNKVFVIWINEGNRLWQDTIYVCRNSGIQVVPTPGWEEHTWDPDSILTSVTEPTKITETMKTKGCTYVHERMIEPSDPILTVAEDGYQIMKGGSVQLVTGGSVDYWHWEPEDGLDGPHAQSPIASPATTTEYVVAARDSLDCVIMARVKVLVQETAFVPNLFTPNGDGKNDNLLIYGLTTSSKFDFRIFNREGSMVYETKDISHATNVGWDGSVRGTRQPSGIYYWKVDGEGTDGNKLLLNGKTTGSILLVH